MTAVRRLSMTITGRVQGVGYRYFAEETAAALGVSGWVRNGWNREVELEAQADTATLDVFVDRLREGPPLSRVGDIDMHDIAIVDDDTSFEVRY
jgi:acylphosphatase